MSSGSLKRGLESSLNDAVESVGRSVLGWVGVIRDWVFFPGVCREWLSKLCLVVSASNFSCIHWHSCKVTLQLTTLHRIYIATLLPKHCKTRSHSPCLIFTL
jgi:hypothetical protein